MWLKGCEICNAGLCARFDELIGQGMSQRRAVKELEKDQLDTLEGVISREMGSFMAVGKALLTIRNGQLYREQFRSFNEYCNVRWGMGRNYAQKMMTGSQVATNLLTGQVFTNGAKLGTDCTQLYAPCEIQPTNEYQVRPLSRLEPAQQCEVWEEAVRTAPVGKVCHFRTPAISVSGGGFPDETAETASGLWNGRRWDGSGGPLAAWQGYPWVPPWRAVAGL